MDRKGIVQGLKSFREEFEQDGADIVNLTAPVPMLLSDICGVLGLSDQEEMEILGAAAAEAIEEWKSARMWELPKEEVAERYVTRRPVAVPA